MAWLTPSSSGAVLTVKATPRSSKTEIVGADPDWLRIRIQAPPVDGKANAELTAFFAKRFGVAKRDVEILAGEGGRLKRVRLNGIAIETLREALKQEGITVP